MDKMTMTFEQIKAGADLVGAPNFRRTTVPCCYHCVYLIWKLEGFWHCKQHDFDIVDSEGLDWLAEFVCDDFVPDRAD